MSVIKVTREEIEEFILGQPDDRPINFKEYHNSNSCCGCLMVQYGQLLNWKFDDVTSRTWWISPENGIKIVAECDDWQFNTWGDRHTTYKTLKEEVLAQRKAPV